LVLKLSEECSFLAAPATDAVGFQAVQANRECGLRCYLVFRGVVQIPDGLLIQSKFLEISFHFGLLNSFGTESDGPKDILYSCSSKMGTNRVGAENSKSWPRITRMSELTRINTGMKIFESCFKQIAVSREDFER
jgi:hypothetical protein